MSRGIIPIPEFRKRCGNIISEYIKANPSLTEEDAYLKLLEKLENKTFDLDNEYAYEWTKRCASACENGDDLEFDKLILEFINQPTPELKTNKIHERFLRYLELLERRKEDNDLTSIFRDCRERFVNKAVRFETQEIEGIDFDEKTLKLVKTGKKEKIKVTKPGRIIKDENGKAKFEDMKEKFTSRSSANWEYDDFV